MQGVLGKRVRKASAKQLALDEQEHDEGHGQPTKKAAPRNQQQQQQQEQEANSSDGVASALKDRAEVGTALLAVLAQAILQEAHGLEVEECSLDSTATEEEPEL